MQHPDETPCALKWAGVLVLLSLVIAACLAKYLLEGHAGFTLWDEGYLWYGVQQVLQGGVPIRDFMSYDPGRYYWAAGLLWLFHTHGIVAVRVATMAFSALGLICAGWLVLRGASGSSFRRFGWCAVVITMCALWMAPWWKGYDEAISIILIASLARVFMRPSAERFLLHGVVVGFAAVFGRNHGLYGVVACLLATPLLMLSEQRLDWRRCIPAWIVGVMLGFSSILMGLVLDHRFAAMFWETIHYILFEYKHTDLPLPVPWPWTISVDHGSLSALMRLWLIGCIFVLLPVFCLVGATVLVRRVHRERTITHPVFAACVVTAIPYLNVAFSRADVAHLAQAIQPCLLGLLVFPWRGWTRTVTSWGGLPALMIITGWVALPLHPGYLMRRQANWQAVKVRGDTLWMDAATASTVEDVKALAAAHVPAGGTLLAAPVWPGVYALLGVRAPVWEIYPVTPHNDAFQQQEITRIQRATPSLVLIYDVGVDGREDLRYEHTYPRVWRYINANYHRIPAPSSEPQLKVYLPVGGQLRRD